MEATGSQHWNCWDVLETELIRVQVKKTFLKDDFNRKEIKYISCSDLFSKRMQEKQLKRDKLISFALLFSCTYWTNSIKASAICRHRYKTILNQLSISS